MWGVYSLLWDIVYIYVCGCCPTGPILIVVMGRLDQKMPGLFSLSQSEYTVLLSFTASFSFLSEIKYGATMTKVYSQCHQITN